MGEKRKNLVKCPGEEIYPHPITMPLTTTTTTYNNDTTGWTAKKNSTVKILMILNPIVITLNPLDYFLLRISSHYILDSISSYRTLTYFLILFH